MKNEKEDLSGVDVSYKFSVKLLSFSSLPHDAISICLVLIVEFNFILCNLY